MSEQQLQGVAGLKKHDIKVSGIVFMLYCLVAAGAICIVLGLVLYFVGKKKDPPLPERELDVDEVLNKYLMEEKTETYFD